jgi:hypothetical protein
MTATFDNSRSPGSQPQGLVAADYIYQGAIILAALLIVLSAAV